MDLIVDALVFVAETARDVLPIAVFLFAFQRLVIGAPMPHRGQIAIGFLFVVLGLGFFLVGARAISVSARTPDGAAAHRPCVPARGHGQNR